MSEDKNIGTAPQNISQEEMMMDEVIKGLLERNGNDAEKCLKEFENWVMDVFVRKKNFKIYTLISLISLISGKDNRVNTILNYIKSHE